MLAMHEPESYILREKPFFRVPDVDKESNFIPFEFLEIPLVRMYLEYELVKRCEKEVDLERVIDDFVFMCFLVGNDFLPHLPTLKIREGAIDLLLEIYKKQLPRFGYLTNEGEVVR